jgi:putative toxin-antitoxin system antitoxin component (TIGR02293 family)
MMKVGTRGFKVKVRPMQRRGWGGSLGLSADGAAQLVRLVRAGFPFRHILHFQKATALSWDKIADFVQIPQRTMTRRQSEGRLRPDESDRVLRAAGVFDMAVKLFEGDADAARRWLQTPQPGLGGEVPLEFASTGVGAREVERLIVRLEHGAFA